MPQDKQALRQIPLLDGERLEHLFSPREGSLSSVPSIGPFLALTNLRILSFREEEGVRETTMSTLEEIRGVSVKTMGRNPKSLYQGLGLVLVGFVSYFVIGLWFTKESLAIPLAVGIAIAFIGFLLLTRYLFWQEEGNIVFLGGQYSWELSFPYSSNKASHDVYGMADRFIQLKLGTTTPRPLQKA